jgi:hypothetical protein
MATRDNGLRGHNRDISSHVLEAIAKGECTLFLGAGASTLGGAPSGESLGELIINKFLIEKSNRPKSRTPISLPTDWGLSLASAVSLASAQPGMFRPKIENFVRNELSGCKPSPAHLKIPWFRWRAIVTTNYDRLIEQAYEKVTRSAEAVQQHVSVLEEEDLQKIGTVDSDVVPLLKPHGCISRPNEMSLSLEDIYQAKKDRRLLFTYMEVLHLLGPVIYIGYSFKDVHILDMIYDITARLGPYRQPILFVTLQVDSQRAEKESSWIEGPLKGIYLAYGFRKFMDALSKQMTPAIAPSMIFRQMAPCQTNTFASIGDVSDVGFYRMYRGRQSAWEYWLTYSINHDEGYIGVSFERKRDLDIRRFRTLIFELNVPNSPRETDYLEGKVESMQRQALFKIDLKPIKGQGWKEVKINFRGKKGIPKGDLRKVVLSDTGHLAIVGRKYKLGLRRARFV